MRSIPEKCLSYCFCSIDLFVLCLASQGADGVRGLKGSKGEKVSDTRLFWCVIRGQCCSFSSDSHDGWLSVGWWITCYHASMYHREKMGSLEPKVTWALQETEWVSSQASQPFSFRYSHIEDNISTCLLTPNLRSRVTMEHRGLVERTDQKGRRVKLGS